jgi:Uma2 family endonuclease
MVTRTETRIWLDNALVIDPRHLGISATGRELEKLFVNFCNKNSDSIWQFELSPDGEIIVMPPVHHPSDDHENQSATRLTVWTDDHGGQARGSNAAFQMPNGGVLVPDASWTSQEKWDAHPHIDGDAHPFCPDFVVEIRSTSDNLAPLHAKMRLYLENGALLGWLIDARNRQVYIYRAAQVEPERLDNPGTLSGEDVLPGFSFDVARRIFDRS